MNSYNRISVGQIIGSVIRRVGLKDTSLVPDMHEWVAEALRIIQFSDILAPDYEQNLKVTFHKVKKPCGMKEILGVGYCGTRLPLCNTIRDPRMTRASVPYSGLINEAVFVSGVTVQDTPNGNKTFLGVMESISNLPWSECEWYKDDGSHILTSFSDGYIDLCFNRLQLDKDGFLQIPEEGNLAECLVWFLRACLAGRGYNNSEYSEEDMYQKFELFAGRAKEAITFPSVDKVQANLNSFLDLMPSIDYYNSFFQ